MKPKPGKVSSVRNATLYSSLNEYGINFALQLAELKTGIKKIKNLILPKELNALRKRREFQNKLGIK